MLIGRVEVCVNRTWGTVCGEMWSDLHASVVCQQVGHSVNGIIMPMKLVFNLFYLFCVFFVQVPFQAQVDSEYLVGHPT